ncbi:MAG: relaxase/mobilization nuclease domain-containing protein, partial [Clostridia bacterium]|nr:relaxase/mobilization nuclease domain-containing protein [Clostridia bacterium]
NKTDESNLKLRKTNDKIYVSGINCLPNIAYQEMMNTKNQFFKTDSIECFHGYQSFVSGEVTPEQAHEIGIKLAQILWGNKYQVLVATHLNTENIHNHFVLNSVSFKDGKRFTNSNKDYNNMRNTSDNLCKEYGLSILPSKYDYSKYAPNNLYKELMKDSIDYAIESAHGYDEFISILNDLNYTVTIRNNELSIKREPYKRNTRILKRFGNSYSLENIQKRILETIPQFNHLPEAYLTINPRLEYYYNCKNKLNKNKSNFSNLFSFYEKLFIVDMKNTSKSKITKYTPELIQAIKQMNEYSKQAIFLGTNNINTEEDLIRFKKEISSKTSPLKSKRENLWKKHKRAKT